MMGINTKSKLTHNLSVSFVSSLRTTGKLLVFTIGGHIIGIKIRPENKQKKCIQKAKYIMEDCILSHV